MKDLSFEELISFAEVARLLPKRRGGKPTHVSTVFRWAQSGCRGVRLRWVQVGGTKCTTRAFLMDFLERLTAGEGGEVKTRSDAQRERDILQAEKEVKNSGV